MCISTSKLCRDCSACDIYITRLISMTVKLYHCSQAQHCIFQVNAPKKPKPPSVGGVQQTNTLLRLKSCFNCPKNSMKHKNWTRIDPTCQLFADLEKSLLFPCQSASLSRCLLIFLNSPFLQ